MSGGNQQKVLIGRLLENAPKVLLLDEPTRGVDVATKAEIYRTLRALARDGVAILVISSELIEIVGLCDRVHVMRDGAFVAELLGDAITEDGIMAIAAAATGGDELASQSHDLTSRALFRFQNVHLAIVGLIAAVFIVGVISSDRFVTVLNIANVQAQLVALALVALAQTVVILSGGIDLSFAGLLGLLSVFFATFAGADPATFTGAYIGILALGTAIGALTGGIVAYTGIHPLIVTLATSTIMAGAALLHTKQPAGSVPIFFEDIVYARFFGFVPWGTSFAIAAYVIVGFVLWRTRFGIRVYAIGDDERAATISGVPVKQTKVLIYALSGFIAALAAIYLVGRFGVGDPRAGIGFDLRSITPVIVGGTLLAGGRGGVLGTFLAVVLLALLANVLNFLNVSNFYLWIVEGVIIVVAVSLFVVRARS